MLEQPYVSLGVAILAGPALWAFTVTTWWAIADLRELWRERRAAAADEYDDEYEPPVLPASRPAVTTYLRALTVAVVVYPALSVVLLVSDVGPGFAAGTWLYLAVRAGRELRTQLSQMRDRAAERVPTL